MAGEGGNDLEVIIQTLMMDHLKEEAEGPVKEALEVKNEDPDLLSISKKKLQLF
jgi:hypothetical protein